MKLLTFLFSFCMVCKLNAQSPCTNDTMYHQFDFWIGNWEVYNPKNTKAGDSKISSILDQCVILEEWKSANKQNGVLFEGKSFNTYNASTKQWQQTWVDNVGGCTEYLNGNFSANKMEFKTNAFLIAADTLAIRKLTFYNLGINKVRQHGQISKDNGNTWNTEFDLEYRRKN
ncbi:MAG: hypothetical protein JNK61_05950 [Bacteroidia bacterium]|nr:hypothetical protein [Bacteroidia bacterium]HQV01296.1 hypothetical protein [Bacteroidia bacterium]